MSTGPRALRVRQRRNIDPGAIPGTPEGALINTLWELEGAGKLGTGVLPKGHPDGGPLGKRILWGEGVWPAEISPLIGDLPVASSRIAPRGYSEPVSLVVHSPAGAITGHIGQPGLQGSLFKALTSGLRREPSKVLIEAGGRAWWLRAVKIFGVRVTRASGEPVLTTRRLRFEVAPDADDLDLSVALLVYSAVEQSTYAPLRSQ
ncbi:MULTISPECIES: hypothetical protein [unclassified Frankia]|uniref:hypothetical protein n=1 Tax=unclassified Frankia TaxID=2632575 RepID=UPI002AD29725|nr:MULTISPECIES: hypothetical protein [unclassified Frankia]